MKYRTLAAVFMVWCFLAPFTSMAQKNIQPKAIGDFNACIQDAGCNFHCWFNTEQGNYNLTTPNKGTIKTGTGIVYDALDQFKLRDVTSTYRLIITVDKETNYSMVVYREGETIIAFSGYRQDECLCQ